MKALIIGATGATGRDLVNVVLQDSDYTEIVLFVRNPSKVLHPKVIEVLTDFNNLEGVASFIKGDVLFSCLGTTLKTAGSRHNQKHIDFEIPVKFAQIAKRNGVPGIVLLSAYGASETSRVFYSRTKGELEKHIGIIEFDQYIIFRPGMLLRNPTDRIGERITAGVLSVLNSLGIVRKFRPLPTSILADKLAKAPKVLPDGKHIIELDKIWAF